MDFDEENYASSFWRCEKCTIHHPTHPIRWLENYWNQFYVASASREAVSQSRNAKFVFVDRCKMKNELNDSCDNKTATGDVEDNDTKVV